MLCLNGGFAAGAEAASQLFLWAQTARGVSRENIPKTPGPQKYEKEWPKTSMNSRPGYSFTYFWASGRTPGNQEYANQWAKTS